MQRPNGYFPIECWREASYVIEMKTLLHVLPLFLIVSCRLFSEELASSSKIEALPSKRIVPTWSADPTAHRISGAKSFASDIFFGGFGGVLPVFNLRADSILIQASAAATVYSSLTSSIAHIFALTTEYYVEGLADARISDHFIVRVGLGHTSHHLVDDAYRIYPGIVAINYARDYVMAGGIYSPQELHTQLYLLAYYNYRFRISSKHVNGFIFQVGGEGVNYPLSGSLILFAGFDLKLRGELGFGTSQNVQVGIRYSGEHGQTTRFAINYQSGLEERGQFYSQRVNFVSVGWYIEL